MNPKGSPFYIFRHYETIQNSHFFIFLDKFFSVSNVSPFTFDILQQIGSSKIPKGPLSPIFGIVRSFKMIIFSRRFSSEKNPTITVSSFFRQTTDLIVYVPLFTETDKFTQAKFDQGKLTAKGPPFHFLPFLRNLQNRKTPKGPPFQFFSALCEIFRKFLMSQKSPPFEFFDILQQNVS